MNQEKISKFIATCRIDKNLTQKELAEKLNVTDRAISNWENGRRIPDSSIMLQLCNELDITVNELLTGEKIDEKKYFNQAENNLIELKKYIEIQNKSKILLSYIFRIISVIVDITLIFVIFLGIIDSLSEIILIIVYACICFTCLFASAQIELTTGYYECNKCGHRYIPNRRFFSFTTQILLKRYLKCPNCHRKNWHEKVLKI